MGIEGHKNFIDFIEIGSLPKLKLCLLVDLGDFNWFIIFGIKGSQWEDSMALLNSFLFFVFKMYFPNSDPIEKWIQYLFVKLLKLHIVFVNFIDFLHEDPLLHRFY